MLLFKKRFLDLIRQGEKTQTIRLWKWARMRAGQRSYIPGVGYIRVTRIDPVELDELTDDDARPDGFPTAEALRREIETLYPDRLREGYRAYRIAFEVMPREQWPKQPKVRATGLQGRPRDGAGATPPDAPRDAAAGE